MPKRRALLIGASSFDLEGVVQDLQLMRGALQCHEFVAIETIASATHAALTEGLERLIASTEPEDAVVIYFSGHGSRWRAEGSSSSSDHALGETAYHHFLVTADFEASTRGDFRGYTNVELSRVLWALTRKTKNVTLILDCCHAGRMSRGEVAGSELPRARGVPCTGQLAQAAAAFYKDLPESSLLDGVARHPEANPHVVRILASTAGGVACEGTFGGPEACGFLTWSLSRTLSQDFVDRLTWQTLGRVVAREPQQGFSQQIGVEGPYRRVIFELDERHELGSLTLGRAEREDGPLLIGGRLSGVEVGDRYELLEPAASQGVVACVQQVAGGHAQLAVSGTQALSGCAISARLQRYGRARALIELQGFSAQRSLRELLDERLRESGYLDVFDPQQASELEVVATISCEAGALQLSSGGIPIADPEPLDREPGDVARLIEHFTDAAHRLARAQALRRLGEHPRGAREQLDREWSGTVHLVEDDQRSAELRGAASLSEGEHFTVEVLANDRLYLTIFAVHADARVELLSHASSAGVEVEGGKAGYVLGQRSGLGSGGVYGYELMWPPALARAKELALDLILIASDRPIDLRAWEQLGVSAFVPLNPLLQPTLSERNLKPPVDPSSTLSYEVRRIQLALTCASSWPADPPGKARAPSLVDRAPEIMRRMGKTRVLFVGMEIEGMPVQPQLELQAIKEALSTVGGRDRFNFDEIYNREMLPLAVRLLEFRPHIVHFCAHGHANGLLIPGPQASVRQLGPPKVLDLVSGHTSLRCVVFNACNSTALARHVGGRVPVVIGVSGQVTQAGAEAFSTGFYSALGAGHGTMKAFHVGRKAMGLALGGAQPVAYLGPPDARIGPWLLAAVATVIMVVLALVAALVWDIVKPSPELPPWQVPDSLQVNGHALTLIHGDKQTVVNGREREVRLDPFYVLLSPVTNAQYTAFLETTGNLRGWGVDESRNTYPAEAMSWIEAGNYGSWFGMELPTQAQWKLAREWRSETFLIPRDLQEWCRDTLETGRPRAGDGLLIGDEQPSRRSLCSGGPGPGGSAPPGIGFRLVFAAPWYLQVALAAGL